MLLSVMMATYCNTVYSLKFVKNWFRSVLTTKLKNKTQAFLYKQPMKNKTEKNKIFLFEI